jgi:hypothetical protein
MGLFDKKFCDFCGNKIGLLGNKKLEDANMCKDCAAKLSPWFSERRHSTKADITKQLEYREQNKSAVASFNATRTLGTTSTKLLIDDNARKFMVTSAKNLSEANPDVLDFSQAVGCDLDVKEHRYEIRHTDSNGKSVSYNPPRYKYSYDFHAIIRVDHPYFDEMKFALSNGSIEVGEQPMNPGQSGGWSVSRSGFNILGNKIDEYYKCVDCGNDIKAAIDAMRTSGPAQAAAPQQAAPQQDAAALRDEARLKALQDESEFYRNKIETQTAQGYSDPNDQAHYQIVTQQIVFENIRNRQNSVLPIGVMGAAPAPNTPEEKARIDALQDEISSLRHKIEAQRQQGTEDQNDMNRYSLLTQQMSREAVRLQTAASLGALIGNRPMPGQGQPLQGQPLQGQPMPGQGMPLQGQPLQGQPMPGQGMPLQGQPLQAQQVVQAAPVAQAAAVPAVGSQVICPMCNASFTLGNAGICIYCGNKIV